MRNFLLLLILSVSSSTLVQASKPISALVDHEAEWKGRALPHAQYVAVELKGLSQSKVLWLNYDWLHEHGFYVPGQGLTPEFENEILDALAYVIPQASDDPKLFNDKIKTAHADGYGGPGIGENAGGGRTASLGIVQAKGSGATPMVGEGQVFENAHGGASMKESIREAIWGEVNHRELPFGSNRVIAILDTGTYTKFPGGKNEKRALIIREDPLRPGHLLSEKVPGSAASIQNELRPHIENYFSTLAEPGEKLSLEEGVNRYFERVPKQFATAHAKRLFHGATNPSNFDVRGKWLDYGTETYVPSYQPVKMLEHKEAFGDSSMLYAQLIAPLKDSPLIPQSIRRRLTQTRFDELYAEAISEEFLKLTGAPPELVAKISSDPKVAAFSRELLQFSREEFSQATLSLSKEIPAELMHTKIGEILKRGASEGSITKALDDLSSVHPNLKTGLASGYEDFMNSLKTEATRENISLPALKTYMQGAAEIIHHETDSLMQPNQVTRGNELIAQYEKDGDRLPIWQEIEHEADSTNRNPYGKNPYEIVVDKKIDHVSGQIDQRVFDLRLNQYRTERVSLIPTIAQEKQGICQTPAGLLEEIIPPSKNDL